MIAAIMPCRGRPEQTVRNVKRLLATAGDVEWRLICVVDGDPDLFNVLAQQDAPITTIASVEWSITPPSRRVGYWAAMHTGTQWIHPTDLIVNLANDLLPGQHWLARGLRDYREAFGTHAGMLGFNDGHHELDHSCHFMIDRGLLASFGGWPTWYDHNYGDTELCQRAIAINAYAKSPWATLYHDHPYFGGDNDAVYAEGRAQAERDRILYEQRKAQGWPIL